MYASVLVFFDVSFFVLRLQKDENTAALQFLPLHFRGLIRFVLRFG